MVQNTHKKKPIRYWERYKRKSARDTYMARKSSETMARPSSQAVPAAVRALTAAKHHWVVRSKKQHILVMA